MALRVAGKDPLTHITLWLESSIYMQGSSPFPGRAKPEFSNSPSSPFSLPLPAAAQTPQSATVDSSPQGFPLNHLRTHQRGDFCLCGHMCCQNPLPCPSGPDRDFSGARERNWDRKEESYFVGVLAPPHPSNKPNVFLPQDIAHSIASTWKAVTSPG